MRVALVQHDIAWEDKDATCARLLARIEQATADGAQLVVLAEMFATGFSMDTAVVEEPDGGPAGAFLRDTAGALGVALAGSLAHRPPGAKRPTNRFVLARGDGTTESYDKIHPFSYGGEAEHYAPGATLAPMRLGELRLTPFVCYDLRFADVFWSCAAETDCYVVVANWPASRQAHWRALLVARAIENQAYVLGVNRVGDGGGISYVGGSLAIDPLGNVLAEAGAGEELLVVDIDPEAVAAVRNRYPFLADRRTIEAEEGLSARSRP